MPEGDTVFVTAQRLNQALSGRSVTRFDLRVPALALADLRGTQVREVVSAGKHILARFSNGQTLHSHLRMDGAWRITSANGPSAGGPAHAIRALVGNSEWLTVGLRVHDLELLDTSEERRVIGHLGPDLMDPDVDLNEAVRRFRNQADQPIAEALLDQRLAAGLGNVYKSELLFLHRRDPWTPVAAVDDLEAILTDGTRLLRANRSRLNRTTTGWHQPGQQYWVYGRGGKACRRCRTRIAKDEGAPGTGRVTYFCPECQRR